MGTVMRSDANPKPSHLALLRAINTWEASGRGRGAWLPKATQRTYPVDSHGVRGTEATRQRRRLLREGRRGAPLRSRGYPALSSGPFSGLSPKVWTCL